MQLINSELSVPVYAKTAENEPWPEDKMFYLLTSDGLFLCRNHQWFQSCAPIDKGPSDLASQKAELTLKYPEIPRALVEKAVAFFRQVYHAHHWESALILVFNRQTQQVELLCPDQTASFGSVNYTIPALQPNQVLIGDFHSHCNFSPEPSMTDENDELNRPGIHLIAGYLTDDKPTFHCIVVVDGTRFKVGNLNDVIEGFESSEDIEVPKEWIDKVKEKHYEYSGYSGGGSSSRWWSRGPAKKDKSIIHGILQGFLKRNTPPSMEDVRQRLVMTTSVDTSYMCCEKLATEFVRKWPKLKGEHDKRTATQQAAQTQAA